MRDLGGAIRTGLITTSLLGSISKVTNSHNLLGLPIPLTYILVHLKKGPTWTNVEFLNTGVDHKVITTRQLKLSKDLSLMTHEQNNSSGKVD